MPPLIPRLALLLAICSTPSVAAEPPRVIVSIAPIHSLVTGIMAGVSEPELLIKASYDPHSYILKPSQMSALQHADIIIWIGETVESYLAKTLLAVGTGSRIIKLTVLPHIRQLPARKGGLWTTHEDEHGHAGHENIDGHIWLDIDNASEITRTLVVALSELDPLHQSVYQHNGQQILQRLDALDQEIHTTLAPVKTRPYMVLHDAFQYFEARYQLNAVGAISVDPERRPGARRLSEIRHRIEANQIVCLFSQPQFNNEIVRMLIKDTRVKSASQDNLGGEFPPGPELYFDMMRQLAKNLNACLS